MLSNKKITRLKMNYHHLPPYMICNRPFASIIIPTYDRPRFLQDAVDNLRQQAQGDFEIIVVDNSPTCGLRSYIDSLSHKQETMIRYISEPRTGLHYARHAGAKAARADTLVYVEDDILAQAGWLEALLAPYHDPRVACTGGKVLPQWEAVPPVWLSDFPPGYHSLLDYGDVLRELGESEHLAGGNFSIRKQVLFEVGGFNPDGFADRKFIWYRGDGECGLLRKIRAADYKIVYAPEAVIKHRIPAKRLTPAYMWRRAFDAGIESDYTNYRQQKPCWGALWPRLCKSAARALYHRVHQAFAQQRGQPGQALKESVAVAHSCGQLLYTFRLLFQPALRLHCLRNSYLD